MTLPAPEDTLRVVIVTLRGVEAWLSDSGHGALATRVGWLIEDVEEERDLQEGNE